MTKPQQTERPIIITSNPLTGEVTMTCRACGGSVTAIPQIGRMKRIFIDHEPQCSFAATLTP